jgi:hypothetical protein
VVKVFEFAKLALTAVGLNPARYIGFLHVRKLSSKEYRWFFFNE